MAIVKATTFLEMHAGKKNEHLREWLQEVMRSLRSQDRLELQMHSSWWNALEALYHASYGVDQAAELLADMQASAVTMGRLSFHANAASEVEKKPATPRVRKDRLADSDAKGGINDLPIA